MEVSHRVSGTVTEPLPPWGAKESPAARGRPNAASDDGKLVGQLRSGRPAVVEPGRTTITSQVIWSRICPFSELVRLIEDHHVHALPVIDETGRVTGMAAESDLLVKEKFADDHVRTPLRRRGRARLAGTTAGEIMTSPVVTIDPSQRLGQAARLIHRRHIGRLPVRCLDSRCSSSWPRTGEDRSHQDEAPEETTATVTLYGRSGSSTRVSATRTTPRAAHAGE